MDFDNGRYRILLHLENLNGPIDNIGEKKIKSVPYGRCQKGIRDAVDLSRPRISQIIKDLIKKNLVKEEVNRVTGLKRRRKVYYLTREGMEKAKNIRSKLERKNIIIKKKSSEQEIELGNINSSLDLDISLLEILNKINSNNVLDLSKSEKIGDAVFKGRDSEIKFLSEKFKDIKNEGCKTIFVKGKAGLGKTRLLNEFKKKLSKENVVCIKGSGHYDTSEPYLPFQKAFEHYPNEKSNSPLTFFEHLFEDNQNELESLEMKRNLMFSRTTENIKELADDKPLAIFIDDLQWVDKSSLILFHYLADNLRKSPILLIGAYRPEDLDNNEFLKEILLRMSREHLYEEIELEELTWENIKEMIKGFLGNIEIPDEFVHMIYKISEGNPLFSKELIKQMIDDEIVKPKEYKFPSDLSDMEIPKVVNAIIESRIERLDNECLRVLQIGSVIGEIIQFDILRRITGHEPFDLLEFVELLLDLNIWEEYEGEDDFRFTHGLIQTKVYESISNPVRKELHRQVAELIEDIYKEKLDKFYSKLGYHYKICEDFSTGLNYYYDAGKKAEEVYAHEDAIEMYKEALKLSEKADIADEQSRILERLGDIHIILGKYEDSLEYYTKIQMKNLDVKSKQRVYRKITTVYLNKTDLDKAKETLEKGLEIQSELNEETARLLYKKGLINMRKGEYDSAEEHFNKAINVVEDHGNDNDRANIYHVLGTNHSHKNEYNKALKFLKKGLAIRKKTDDFHGKAFSYTNIGVVYLHLGEIKKSLEYLQKGMEIFQEVGDKGNMGMLYTNMGNCYSKKGELQKAYENHKKSYEIFKDIGGKRGINISLNNLGDYYLLIGDLKNAEKYYENSLSMSMEIGLKFGIAIGYNNLGVVYHHKGNKEKARELYRNSIEMSEEIGNKKVLINALSGLADTYINEEFEKASRFANRGLDISKEIESKIEEGMIYRTLGKLYREHNDMDLSKDYFERGKRILEDTGEKIELAKLLFEYAIFWKKKNDNQRYSETQNKANCIFKEFGVDLWIDKCKSQ